MTDYKHMPTGWVRKQYDRQVQQAGGVGTSDYSLCGPPNWNRDAWERFRSQYGRYPFDAFERPPMLETAPAWVKALCGGHPTPAER